MKAGLTVKEKRILELWAQGYHPKEIAPMINLSRVSVNFYGRMVRAKLRARTTPQAVAIAVANHLIRLNDIPEFEED